MNLLEMVMQAHRPARAEKKPGGLLGDRTLETLRIPETVDALNRGARDWSREMSGSMGSLLSVRPDVQEQGMESLLQALPTPPGMFAGVAAKTANKAALQQAQTMAKAGADPVEVWKTTGWTDQFPDGKWRFEISDDQAYLPWNKKEGIGNLIENARFQGPARMGSVMKHPELAKAYPEMMEDIHISDVRFGGRGSFRPPAAIHLNSGLSVDEALSPLLHEGQHAIQNREGFALGGSPARAWKHPETKSLIDRLETELNAAIEARDKAKFDVVRRAINELESKSGMGAYRRLAGEAEARLTQARMALTPAERAARPPWLEFDVPREQQIVRSLLDSGVSP